MEASGKKILIDSDIFIDFLRNQKSAIKFFQNLRNDITFCAITEVELLAGRENNDPEKRKVLLRMLARCKKIAVDNPLTQRAGDIRRSTQIALPDALIAATALQENAILYSRNIQDFQKVPGLIVKSPY